MSEADLDTHVRTQAFEFLTEKTRLHGEVVPRDLLQGFQGTTILRPTSLVLWPRSDFLAERYEEFRRAS